MSLALAEILFKQDGLSSLDRAREEHRHHGLELRVQALRKDAGQSLEVASSALAGAPLVRTGGDGFGTFELWHRTARETPLGGDVETINAGASGSTTGFRGLFFSPDKRLPRIPGAGLSLFECLRCLPGMYDYVRQQGIIPYLVRGRCELRDRADTPSQHNFSIILHPSDAAMLAEFYSNLKFEPDAVNRIQFVEMQSGGIVRWQQDAVSGQLRAEIPNGSMWHEDEVRFWPATVPLNEFGYLFVALYIAGNYARYYPDKWLADVENATPLALAIEELLGIAERRMALLTLSELDQTYYVAPN